MGIMCLGRTLKVVNFSYYSLLLARDIVLIQLDPWDHEDNEKGPLCWVSCWETPSCTLIFLNLPPSFCYSKSSCLLVKRAAVNGTLTGSFFLSSLSFDLRSIVTLINRPARYPQKNASNLRGSVNTV